MSSSATSNAVWPYGREKKTDYGAIKLITIKNKNLPAGNILNLLAIDTNVSSTASWSTCQTPSHDFFFWGGGEPVKISNHINCRSDH